MKVPRKLLEMAGIPVKKSKYNAKKTVVDGITFHSKAEAARWVELCRLQELGAITDLERQVVYKFVFWDETGKIKLNRRYVADFRYKSKGELVVEDVKGKRLRSFIERKKWMKLAYGIDILET